MSRLSKAAKAASAGKPRRLCGYKDDFGDWDVYVVRQDDPAIRKRLMYPTHRQWPDGTVDRAAWTESLLLDALQPALTTFARAYVGRWYLDLRAAEKEPKPGNHRAPSFVQVTQQLTFPSEPPPKRTATRAEIDALDKPLPPAEHETRTDPEFFAAHPVEEDDEPWERG